MSGVRRGADLLGEDGSLHDDSEPRPGARGGERLESDAVPYEALIGSRERRVGGGGCGSRGGATLRTPLQRVRQVRGAIDDVAVARLKKVLDVRAVLLAVLTLDIAPVPGGVRRRGRLERQERHLGDSGRRGGAMLRGYRMRGDLRHNDEPVAIRICEHSDKAVNAQGFCPALRGADEAVQLMSLSDPTASGRLPIDHKAWLRHADSKYVAVVVGRREDQ